MSFRVYHPHNLEVPVTEDVDKKVAEDAARKLFPGVTLIGQDTQFPSRAFFVGPFPGSIRNNNHMIAKKIRAIYNHNR